MKLAKIKQKILDLPKASTGTPQMREIFVVSLDDLGQLYV